MSARRRTLRERFRWWVATRLETVSWICWCDVVDWALQGDKDRRKDIDPGEHIGLLVEHEDAGALLRGVIGGTSVDHCKSEARTCGSCYCGRFVRDDVYLNHREDMANRVFVSRDYVPTWIDHEPILRREASR